MLEIEGSQGRQATPELRLWRQALALLVTDAMRHHEGRTAWNARPEQAEAAFDDLMNCGYRLKYLCAMAGTDADYYCERFRRWVKQHPAGVPLDGRAKRKRHTA